MKFWTTRSPLSEEGALKARAISLARWGRFAAAIETATAANRIASDEKLERLLVDWRIRAMRSKPRTRPNPDWQQGFSDPFPGHAGLPEIQASELTTATMAGAIVHHGGLLVRGLISSDDAARFRAGMEQALSGFAAWSTNPKSPPDRWFSPVSKRRLGALADNRRWMYSSRCTFAADSPRMLFEAVELLERTRVIDTVTQYFAERPALSFGKTTLRKVSITQNQTAWHQDGQFLGTDVRSVNLWVALSDCGRDAAGIDLVPKRIPHILDTGSRPDVAQSLVDQIARDAPVCSPNFAAGDALLFDHLFLHRTGLPAERTKERHALECWMFAPSCFPNAQCALLL